MKILDNGKSIAIFIINLRTKWKPQTGTGPRGVIVPGPRLSKPLPPPPTENTPQSRYSHSWPSFYLTWSAVIIINFVPFFNKTAKKVPTFSTSMNYVVDTNWCASSSSGDVFFSHLVLLLINVWFLKQMNETDDPPPSKKKDPVMLPCSWWKRPARISCLLDGRVGREGGGAKIKIKNLAKYK